MSRFGILSIAVAALVAALGVVDPFSVSSGVALAQGASFVDGSSPQPLHGVLAPRTAVYETGVASTYGEGDGFEGNLTACGRVFHTQVVQVAHKSLPCGTLIRIENADTGGSIVAEVTDRGPYVRGRIVDLSWAAFRQLEPSAPGLLKVNVYLLDS